MNIKLIIFFVSSIWFGPVIIGIYQEGWMLWEGELYFRICLIPIMAWAANDVTKILNDLALPE